MLSGQTIICVSPSSWYSLWRNRQQIMSRLAKKNTVLFIEPQRNPESSLFNDLRVKAKNLTYPGIINVQKNLWVVDVPPAVPSGAPWAGPFAINAASASTVINNYVLTRTIKLAMAALNVKSPILWLYLPWHVGLLGQFSEKLVCYHIYDELAEYPSNYPIRDFIQRCDMELSRKADIIFASSSIQAGKRKAFNENTFFVPNAVDFDHFNKALNTDLELPEAVKNIPHPVIGYIGLLSFQIDVSLLVSVAKARPNWHLILAGPDNLGHGTEAGKLREMTNVHFIGKKEVSELPAYLKSLDVALLPYDLTTHMATSYPLKLHEYLAGGKPIVSVDMPELRPFREYIYIAQGTTDFIAKIEQALEEKSTELVAKRVKVASENTWDKRVAQITALLEKQIDEKNKSRA